MGGLFQLFWVWGTDFQELGHRQPFGLLTVGLETIMTPLGVSFSLLTEDQGLVKADLSAILGPFDSNWSMLCPWAMSFFQKSCLAPFPPILPWLTLCAPNAEKN